MSGKDEITKYKDMLNSLGIQERIDCLRDEESVDRELSEEESIELESLLSLRATYIDDYNESSWESGAQFIRESYFESYAQELADDCGMIDDNMKWPATCIDWEQAARELAMDYTTVTFDGVDYYTQEA